MSSKALLLMAVSECRGELHGEPAKGVALVLRQVCALVPKLPDAPGPVNEVTGCGAGGDKEDDLLALGIGEEALGLAEVVWRLGDGVRRPLGQGLPTRC